MAPPESTDEARALCVPLDLFDSEWFRDASESLSFGAEARRVLDAVARETVRERDAILSALDAWAGAEEGADRVSAVSHLARVDFLRTIIEAKESTAQIIERAAALAPPGVRTRLIDLATIDFRHAEELRQILRLELRTPIG